jgi:hypothetical protein
VVYFFTPLRPFRCSACQWRGWRIPLGTPAAPISPPGFVPEPVAPQKPLQHTFEQLHRQRQRRQIAIVVILSVVVGASVTICQREHLHNEANDDGTASVSPGTGIPRAGAWGRRDALRPGHLLNHPIP